MPNINVPESYQTKNFVVDKLLQHLQTVAECKTVNIVYRQSIGWQKNDAPISVVRFEQLSGMDRKSIAPALEWLVSVGVLVRGPQTAQGVVYSPQLDETKIDWAKIENRSADAHSKTKSRTAKSLEKANAKKAQSDTPEVPTVPPPVVMSAGGTVPPLEVATDGTCSGGTVPHIETKETKFKPKGADAPNVSIADATQPKPSNPISRTDTMSEYGNSHDAFCIPAANKNKRLIQRFAQSGDEVAMVTAFLELLPLQLDSASAKANVTAARQIIERGASLDDMKAAWLESRGKNGAKGFMVNDLFSLRDRASAIAATRRATPVKQTVVYTPVFN